MIADTSDLHALRAAQLGHADDLSAIAADLTAATVAADAFGSVGTDFLTALNHALIREAAAAVRLAQRLNTAASATRVASDGYRDAEGHVGQSIWLSQA